MNESDERSGCNEREERPPVAEAALSVVLVGHNDRAHLEGVLEAWTAYLNALARNYEVLLIDDGSTDGMSRAAEALLERHPQLRLLRHNNRRGLGAALRTGLQHARFPLISYTTCDHQYQPTDLGRLLEWIDRTDLVGGYRVGPRGRRPRGFKARAYRWLIRFLFAVRLRDLDCLFLLARRTIFARIPIQSDGPFAHVEILAKANFLGCLMTEAPVSFQVPQPESSITKATSRSLLGELYQVFLHPDFGPPIVAEDADPSGLLSKP